MAKYQLNQNTLDQIDELIAEIESADSERQQIESDIDSAISNLENLSRQLTDVLSGAQSAAGNLKHAIDIETSNADDVEEQRLRSIRRFIIRNPLTEPNPDDDAVLAPFLNLFEDEIPSDADPFQMSLLRLSKESGKLWTVYWDQINRSFAFESTPQPGSFMISGLPLSMGPEEATTAIFRFISAFKAMCSTKSEKEEGVSIDS